jgi:Outer membrane protein beta-barrel domain
MKKINLIACALTLSTAMWAQINLGIKAGYSSSLNPTNLNSLVDGSYNLNNVTNELSNEFHFGGFGRLNIGKVYIQPELLYSAGRKEYTFNYQDALAIQNGNYTVYKKIVNISTVDIPLMIGYKVLDLKLINARVYAGPKFRLNAGSSLEFDNITNGGNVPPSGVVNDIKSSQISFEAGVGVDVLMFTLDARCNLGSNMYQYKLDNSTIDNALQSNFIISVGYKFF